jgi:hypothetical protein
MVVAYIPAKTEPNHNPDRRRYQNQKCSHCLQLIATGFTAKSLKNWEVCDQNIGKSYVVGVLMMLRSIKEFLLIGGLLGIGM